MKKIKQKFLSRISGALDFPSDIYSGGFRIEMYSDTEAVAYGVRGIEDYTSERVELFYKRGRIIFSGRALGCDSYVDGVVCIKGEICKVDFERR